MRLRGLATVIAALALAPAAGAETVVAVQGRGWGHGIGMSQWGARGMAERGRSYQRILAHYYPGTRLGLAPMSRVRILLAAGKKMLRGGSKRTFNLLGVVPYEMPSDWPRSALRAQAVVARSYALATRKPGKIYDLHADQRSQVYGGIRAETPATSAAIGSTAGRVLLWRGEVATTFYHSTSGGRTAPAWEVWPDARHVPYLRGVRDPFDHGPHHSWGPVVLRGKKLLRRAHEIDVVRGRSGRVTAVVLDGWRIPGADFRRTLKLRSTWFHLAVLRLDPLRARQLRGLARGVRGAVVQRLDRGRWRRVARVHGSFRVRVRRAGRYRLAAIGIRGPTIRLTAARLRTQAAASTR